ncbi:MAG: family 43 glycosylhydrolase [Muribaculaceae bacterium]|nr:family 43 glycosylhydrolase [Muribaculaceae bacterium]
MVLGSGCRSTEPQQDYSAYLFAYFTGNDISEEQICFAVSDDGYNYTALNDGHPVIASADISSTGGVRDPHILRSPDGKSFRMVVTDMVSAKGWDSNRAMVLMRSDDLVNWTSSVVNIQERFPGNEDLLRVWAPQTIFDPEAGKYMIYWSMKHGQGEDIIYYAYANDDFTDLATEPKVLFTPADGKSCIDGDIVLKDGTYHLFYKTEGHGNGIKVATTKSLTSGQWSEEPDYKQQTSDAVEGAGTFRLIDSDTYILMYDVYMNGRYEFTESTDLSTFTPTAKEVSMDFHPRHGSVIPITGEELARLREKWPSAALSQVNPVRPGWHADPEILYSANTGRYYIYSTTDGKPGWGGSDFRCFSSENLKDWTDEGIVLDLASEQVAWADGNAWAPAIEEKANADGTYSYYLYFSGNSTDGSGKQIGVAVADSPTGPFRDLGHPIVASSPTGHGQQIDVDVFTDPVSGKSYLYWGNGYMAGAELDSSMTAIVDSTLTVMTPEGGTLATHEYREAPYVFYHDGRYYFLWSVDDTGSPNYHVAYGTSDSPLGKITVADPAVILIGRPEQEIYGTAHCSVVKQPGSDEWLIAYHRINPSYLENSPGTHRQVCIDRMQIRPDGTIAPVEPSK